MNNDIDAELLWATVDKFIDLANEQKKQLGSHQAGMAMTYAASRFQAFLLAEQSGTAEALDANTETAVEAFMEQYRTMLTENLKEYHQNFAEYMQVKSQSSAEA